MENFVIWIRQISAWLYVPIYQNRLFFIDFWSFVHLWSGLMLLAVLVAIKSKRTFVWLVVFLALYEVFEISLIYFALGVFYPETIKDQFTDIFAGIAGGALGYFHLSRRQNGTEEIEQIINVEFLLVSLTMAFIWAGNFKSLVSFSASGNSFSVTGFFFTVILIYQFLRLFAELMKKKADNKMKILLDGSMFLFLLILTVSWYASKDGALVLSFGQFVELLTFLVLFLIMSMPLYFMVLSLFKKASEILQ